jgi:hypothetical protein
MATKPEIRKHLEAILGYKLPAGAAERIDFVQAVASSTVSDGFTTLRNLIVPRPNRCYQARLLDVSGIATTGNDGKSRFRLTDFLCHTGETFGEPINVVATPLSSTPCFLTVIHSLVNDGADVEIQVSTWDASGTAAPTVSFDWRCRVELKTVIK